MRLPGMLLRATMFALVSPMCAAQSYPAKPVRIIVPQPAGSTPDLVARLIAPGLSTMFGQQFIIDNRGGAGGLIGTELAAWAGDRACSPRSPRCSGRPRAQQAAHKVQR